MSGRNEGPDDETKSAGNAESNRRRFLRDAALAGAALAAGTAGMSAASCCIVGKKQVRIEGRTLVIVDRDLKAQLCRIWNDQLKEKQKGIRQEPSGRIMGIGVEFEPCGVPGGGTGTGGIEPVKVNSLCTC